MIVENITSELEWQPVTLEVTFETPDELKAFYDIVGDSCHQQRAFHLSSACGHDATPSHVQAGHVVSNILSMMWDEISEQGKLL